MGRPNFNEGELMYIEVIMDINASIGIDRLEKFQGIKKIGIDSKIEKEIMERMEKDLNDSMKITNKIRDKIESWRKEDLSDGKR